MCRFIDIWSQEHVEIQKHRKGKHVWLMAESDKKKEQIPITWFFDEGDEKMEKFCYFPRYRPTTKSYKNKKHQNRRSNFNIHHKHSTTCRKTHQNPLDGPENFVAFMMVQKLHMTHNKTIFRPA